MSYKVINALELSEQYQAGQRNFQSIKIEADNLDNIDLSGADLKRNFQSIKIEADNLDNIDLSGADLSGSHFYGSGNTEADVCFRCYDCGYDIMSS